LRGLSILGVCSECGTPVRATILTRVDPQAKQLKPLTRPGLTAWGLVVWGGGGFVAAILTWWLRVAEFRGVSNAGWTAYLAWGIVACVALSGLGSLVLVRPHAGLSRQHEGMALAGSVLTFFLAWVLWVLHVEIDGAGSAAFFGGGDAPVETRRHAWRIAALALMLLVMLLLRPHARQLYVRSLLMRTGRMDRQTMAAMIAVVGIIALGDTLVLASAGGGGAVGSMTRLIGQIVILFGSLLLTVGLGAIVVDVVRLKSVIEEPALGIEDVVKVGRS
jgi:hypothetical protein